MRNAGEDLHACCTHVAVVRMKDTTVLAESEQDIIVGVHSVHERDGGSIFPSRTLIRA